MKILLVNDLSVGGGAEVQHWRELNLLKTMGHEVYSLTFDEKLPTSAGPKYNIPILENSVQKFLTRMSESRYREQVEEIIDGIQPDVIHLNNIIKVPLALYNCVASYPCMQTIRDYGAICPKSTCIHDDFSICKGEMIEECRQCKRPIKERIKEILRRKSQRARMKAVDLFVSPSNALADACSRNHIETICLNNPFDFSLLPERKFNYSRKNFLYYGVISEAKGVGILLNAFQTFSTRYPDATLSLAGRIDKSFKDKFLSRINNIRNISYLGILSNQEMLDVLSTVYCVVVPSLWIENYPNTVLEPLASKVLVIGSDRGGIPELIQDSRFTFDVTNQKSIIEALGKAYDLSEEEYRSYVSDASERIRVENSLQRYYDKLYFLLRETILKNREEQS
jgi:glycosyltransferase involved in cell wall biosynthesis